MWVRHPQFGVDMKPAALAPGALRRARAPRLPQAQGDELAAAGVAAGEGAAVGGDVQHLAVVRATPESGIGGASQLLAQVCDDAAAAVGADPHEGVVRVGGEWPLWATWCSGRRRWCAMRWLVEATISRT